MSEPRALQVYSNDALVGLLTEHMDIWRFQYSPGWLASASPWALGPGLPLRPEEIIDGSTNRPVQWFFDNLLPEEMMRTALAKDAKVSDADAFALLQYLGRESAGSLVLLPAGEAPDPAQTWHPLPMGELSERISNMPRQPLSGTGRKRMSVAGAQQKLLAHWDGRALSEPDGNTPSTHILKPDNSSVDYPHTVINEYAMMKLARSVGLDAPPVWRIYCPQPVYIVERFDRQYVNGGRIERMHIIDACQLCNLPRSFKYQQASIQTLRAIVDGTRNKVAARLYLWRWLVFNLLIGNNDNHLKNLSVHVDGTEIALTPVYDLLSTAVYDTIAYSGSPVWPRTALSIALPGVTTFHDVDRNCLLEAAKVLGVPPSPALRELDLLRGQMPVEMKKIIARIELENKSLPAGAAQYLGGELRLLRTIQMVIINDMIAQTK